MRMTHLRVTQAKKIHQKVNLEASPFFPSSLFKKKTMMPTKTTLENEP
jgi:hypothetical protein